MASEQFQIADIVKLKSGGPPMTVESVSADDDMRSGNRVVQAGFRVCYTPPTGVTGVSAQACSTVGKVAVSLVAENDHPILLGVSPSSTLHTMHHKALLCPTTK